jgi:uracil-DNA glycosylase family 4
LKGFFAPSSWKSKEAKIGLPQCGRCGLLKMCRNPKLEVEGTGDRPILFVGEMPSKRDDKRGRVFLGDQGRVLRQMLDELGESLEDCWATYSVICRPNRGLQDYQVEACRPNLLRAMEELKPKVVVLLGQNAVSSLVGVEWGRSVESLSRWVGWTIPSKRFDCWLCPTYSPNFILQKEEEILWKIMKGHVQKAFDLIDKKPEPADPEKLKKEIEIIDSPATGRARMEELSTKSGRLAFDYETTGLKPDDPRQEIVSVAFTHEGRDTFACPIEKKSLRALSKVLRNPDFEFIAANMKFEDRWTRAKCGHPVANWIWDTMVMAHMLDNRSGITSVKFQAFIEFGIGDYDSQISPFLKSQGGSKFNRIRECNQHDLLLYNGMDALIEWMLYERQRDIMERKI